MIFWIASYPKSGNTWLRALISAYYYSQDGVFNQNILKNIGQFPEKKYLTGFDHNQREVGDTARFWIKAQEKINEDKKIRFFKTHNIFGAVNNCKFSNKQNSAGCIYIVRDPRNVITSIKNHYELDDGKALEWMINSKKFIYDVERVEQYGYSDFQFISSWSTNYKSWRVQKEMPIKIIRYEDLLKETYIVFKDVIEFINKIYNKGKEFKKGNSPYNAVVDFLKKNKNFKIDNFYENKSFLTVAKKGFLKKIR